MHRAMSSFGTVWLAFCTLFTAGCIAETSEPTGLIWYDDELGACFTENTDGKAVEVPCDEAEPTVEAQNGGLLCPTCCPIILPPPEPSPTPEPSPEKPEPSPEPPGPWKPVCPDP